MPSRLQRYKITWIPLRLHHIPIPKLLPKRAFPSFLSLFLLLETFYVAGVPNTTIHLPGDQIHAGNGRLGDTNCPCPNDKPRHSWPLIRNLDACGWFLIYDEHSVCPFSKFDNVEKIRLHWCPHFPYYRALNYLEIEFIQLWDPDSRRCRCCVYT